MFGRTERRVDRKGVNKNFPSQNWKNSIRCFNTLMLKFAERGSAGPIPPPLHSLFGYDRRLQVFLRLP